MWPAWPPGPRRCAPARSPRPRTTCWPSPATDAEPPSICAWSVGALTPKPASWPSPPRASPASITPAAITSISTPGGSPTRGPGPSSWCSVTCPPRRARAGTPMTSCGASWPNAACRPARWPSCTRRAPTRPRPSSSPPLGTGGWPCWSAPPTRWGWAPTSRPALSPCTTSTAPGGRRISSSERAGSAARATRARRYPSTAMPRRGRSTRYPEIPGGPGQPPGQTLPLTP